MAHSRSPSISSSSSSSANGSKTNNRASSKPPGGLAGRMVGQVEMLVSYVWLVIQLVLLVAGLTVLHFSTMMVTLTYVVYGCLKGRREFYGNPKHSMLRT